VLWVENRSPPARWGAGPAWWPASDASLFDAPELVVSLPPPHPLGVRVTDLEGKLLAGVDVAVSLFDTRPTLPEPTYVGWTGWPHLPRERCWRTVGTSDGNGMATLVLPARVEDHKLMTPVHLRASAPGHGFGYSGLNAWPAQPYVNWELIPVPADNVLPIVLSNGSCWSVREGSAPARARDLAVFANRRIPSSAPLCEVYRLLNNSGSTIAVPFPPILVSGLLLAVTSGARAEGTAYF